MNVDPEKLNKFLDLLLESVKSGGEFVAEQAPLVIQELIVWKRAQLTLTSVALLIAAVLLARFGYKMWVRFKEETLKNEDSFRWTVNQCWCFWWATPCTVGSVVSSIFCIISTYWCLMVWFAPRLYVIIYITELVRGK